MMKSSDESNDGAAARHGARTPTRDTDARTLPRSVSEALKRSDLPAPLTDLIRKVVRRSRLWRSERVEVACELIAHFQDGLDHGAGASELADAFGDAKQAATLIRRAKKRNRPRWWRAMRRTMQGVAGLIVIYALLALWYVNSEPTIRRDYVAELNVIPASVVPEDRAWPHYREALAPIRDNDALIDLLGIGPTHPDWPALKAELERHADDLDRLRHAASMPALGYVAGPTLDEADRAFFGGDVQPRATESTFELLNLLLPHLAAIRQGAQALASDARLAVETGDAARAVRNTIAILRMSNHVLEHPTLINQLVRFAVLSLAIDALGDVLAGSPATFSDGDLQRVAHVIADAAGTGPIRIDLRGERMFFEDFIQHVYTDDGEGGGHMTPRGLELFAEITELTTPSGDHSTNNARRWTLDDAWQTLAAPALALVMPDRREIMRRYDAIVSAMEREMAMPLWRAEFEAEQELMHPMNENAWQRWRYWPIALSVPALRTSAVNAELLTQRRDAIQTAIALELHRRRHGDWPNSLEELVPNLLPSVPQDRFDGKPLRYVVRDGRATLYSIGSDHDDDGGRPAMNQSGEPDQESAGRWVHPDHVDTRPDIPDGDWVLWQSR